MVSLSGLVRISGENKEEQCYKFMNRLHKTESVVFAFFFMCYLLLQNPFSKTLISN